MVIEGNNDDIVAVDDSFGAVDTATVIVTATAGGDGSFPASMAPAGGQSLLSAFLPAGGGERPLARRRECG